MSTTVDERVVSMQFDNKNFEKNVSTTMTTLDKLKASLNLTGATKGLEDVNSATKKVDMGVLERGVEAVRVKFSALQVMGITALTNITNSAINAGKRIVSSLTIDPIKMGLSEYETQLNSIQTILANTESKGSTLTDVNAALDELNEYADKTIYNFTEMTRNIGTFTAAGVDLDTSVSAIKGIANLAAVSGSTSQQASTAMYQLSQALSSGTVRLMDWNSVVNAGMGGQVFQDALKETARVHGIAIDDIIKQQGSFRESLSEGWLSSEILTETLSKFTGDLSEAQLESMGYTQDQIKEIMKLGKTANDAATKVKTFTQLMDTLKESAQSGWAQTWEIIMGDFGEAKELWTMASKAFGGLIGESATKRNELLSAALSSGWKQLLGTGVFDEQGYQNHIMALAKENGYVMEDMINDTYTFEDALKDGLKNGKINSDTLKKSLGNLASEYADLNDTQLENLGVTREQVDEFLKLNEAVQNGSISMEEFAEKIIKPSGRELLIESITNIFKALGKILMPIKKAWDEIFSVDASGLYSLIEKFRDFTASLIVTDETSDKIRRTFKGLFAVLDTAFYIISTLVGIIFDLVGHFSFLGGGILSVTAKIGDFLVYIRDLIKGSKGITDFTSKLSSGMEKAAKGMKNFMGGFKEKIDTSEWSGFVDFFKGVFNTIKRLGAELLNILGSIGSAIFSTIDGTGVFSLIDVLNAGLLAGIFVSIKKAFDTIDNIVDGFTGVLDSVRDSLKAFTAQLKAKAIETIAKSMLMLAAAVLVLALINKEKLETALAAITLLFVEMSLLLGLASNLKTFSMPSMNVITIALALLVMASVLTKLSKIPSGDLVTSILGMTAVMYALVGALAIMSKLSSVDKYGIDNMAVKGAKQMLIISLALLPLAFVLKQLSTIYWEDLYTSLGAMVIALYALVGVVAILSTIKDTKMAIRGSWQLIKISMALLPMAVVIKMLAGMDWPEIGKVAVVMAAGLTALLIALTIINKIDQATGKVKINTKINILGGKCTQLTMIAAALATLAITLAVVAKLKWTGIIKGLITITAALAILIGALKIVSNTDVDASGRKIAVLLTLTYSLIPLGMTLAILGQMEWETIAKGLTAMVGAMGTLALAYRLMGNFKSLARDEATGSLLGITENVSMTKNAASLLILSVAITSLALSIGILGQLKWETIARGLTAMGSALAILAIASKFVAASSISLKGFATTMLMIGAAFFAIGAGVYMMAVALNLLGESIGIAIASICQAIIGSAASISEAVSVLLSALLDSLVAVSDKLVTVLLTVITNTLESLSSFIPDIVHSVMELVVGVVDELINYVPEIIKLLAKLLNALFQSANDLFAQLDTTAMQEGAVALAAMAAMVLILAKVATSIPKALIGVLGLIGIMTVLTTIFGILGKFDAVSDFIVDSGKIFGAIGTALGMLIGGLIGGLAGGVQIGSNLDNVLAVIQKLGEPKTIAALAGLAGVMVILSKVSSSLKGMAVNLASLTLAVVTVLGVVSIFSVLASVPGSLGFFEKGVKVLQTVCSAEVITSIALVGALIAGIHVLAKLAKNTEMKAFLKNVGFIGIMIAGITALVGIFGGLAAIDGALGFWTKGVEILKTVCSPEVIGAIAMAGLLATAIHIVTDKVGVEAKTILKGSLALVAMIAAITAVVAGLGGIAQIGKDGAALALFEDGVKMLELICSPRVVKAFLAATALGIIGSAISGIISATGGIGAIVIYTAIPALAGLVAELGLLIAAFGGIAQKYPNAVTMIEAGGEILQSLGTALGKVVGGFAGGIAQGFTSSLPAMADDFSNFMTRLKPFLDGLSTISPEMGKAATDLATALLVLTGADLLRQLTSWLTGDADLSEFAESLKPLGDGMAAFGAATANIGVDTVKAGADALKTIAQAITELPKEGGWMQNVFGSSTDLESFSEGLTCLGGAVYSFNQSVSGGINLEQINNGAEAVKIVAKAMESMPKSGWWEKILGARDVEGFSEDMTALGEGVAGFASAVASDTFNPENVTAGANGTLTLAQALNEIPNTNAVKEWMNGKKDLSTFKKNITKLGEGIAGFAGAVSIEGFTPEQVSAGTSSLATIMSGIKLIPEKGGIWKMDTGKFKTKLGDLGTAVVNFTTNSSEVGVGDVSDAATKLNKITSTLDTFNKETINSITTSFDKAPAKISKSISSALTKGVDKIKSFKDKFKDAGKKLGSYLVEGLEAKEKSVKKQCTTLVNTAKNAIHNTDNYDKFYDAGVYLAKGFAKGIADTEYYAEQKAAALGRATAASLEESIEVNSPSKLTMKTGRSFGKGFVYGIAEYGKKVYDAAVTMGGTASTGLSDAVSRVESIISSDMDVQPTITPVLNLDQVSAGMGVMNKMFGSSPMMLAGAAFEASSIGAMMNKNQNRGNDDVVSAIKKLEDKMDNISNNTTIIDGVTYSDGSEMQQLIAQITRALKVERRK